MEHDYDNQGDEHETLFRNDSEPLIDDDDDDATIVGDQMLEIVNDANRCLNQNINESCDNEGLASTNVLNEVNEYKKLIEDAKRPLYPGCVDFTKLSATVEFYNLKVKSGWSDTSFDQMLKLQKKVLPKDNTFPDSAYAAKKLIKSLGLNYDMIHACPNDCILYRGSYESKDQCPTCGKSRWKVDAQSQKVRKGVPAKVLRYFPIAPRLKRMYRYDLEHYNFIQVFPFLYYLYHLS